MSLNEVNFLYSGALWRLTAGSEDDSLKVERIVSDGKADYPYSSVCVYLRSLISDPNKSISTRKAAGHFALYHKTVKEIFELVNEIIENGDRVDII